LFLIAAGLMASTASSSFAQDSHGHGGDVEIGYDNVNNPMALIFEVGESTTEGIALFESEFEPDTFDPNDMKTDEPGFTTNPNENLLIRQGDRIWLNVLDADAESDVGVGFVNFYNPQTDSLEASGRLSVDGTSSAAELLINGGQVESGSTRQFIDVGNAAQEAHDHVLFDLLDDATALPGAYGILIQLESNFAGNDSETPDLVSDKLWVVINHGLDEEVFENQALRQFGIASAVPEPSSLALLMLGGVPLLIRRKR